VAADFALAAASAACEERGAVEYDAEAAAAVLGRSHLRDEVHQEEEGAVRDPWQARSEAPVEALRLVLLADLFLDLLPLHAKRRIGEHVVELLVGVTVIGEGVACD